MVLALVLVIAFCAQQLVAVNTVVDLGYARYEGKAHGNGISSWLGMRYARSASRVEGMRFAPPQDPLPQHGIVKATEFGPICIGSGSKLEFEFGTKWSEDCLFANVFAPTNATKESKLPVYVFIQGGGFNVNGNANYNGTDLIDAAGGSMVVVNFNYRVGPYGFLASEEIVQNDSLSLNNGLKDQRQLLKWVKTHIAQFGGDPGHVTLGGASAGAGSVVLQLTAYGGRDDGLFHAVAAESPAFPPMRNVSLSQWSYDKLLEKTGCENLDCLRALDAVKFQDAVRNLKLVFPGAKNPPLYFWNPTLDYDFIQDYTYNELKKGKFVKVPTIIGDTTNEGTVFTPKSVTSLTKAEQFVTDQFPNLDQVERKRIQSVWQGPTDAMLDTRWRNVASDVYGHIRYTCPGLNISSSYVEDGTAPTWQYRWNVGQALHVGEIGSIWNNGTSAASSFIQNYWASFIQFYDPNNRTVTYHASGQQIRSPTWETFGVGNGRRILFNDKNDVRMEEVTDLEWDRCDVISGMGIQLEQIPSAGATAHLGSWKPYVAYGMVALSFVQWLCP